MALKDLGIGLVIGGTLASSFKTSFNTANTSITALGSNINKLSNTRLDIKNFRSLSKDATKNKTALNQLGSSLKKAGVDVRHLDKDSKLLNRSLLKLKKASKISIQLESNKAAFAQQKASILGLGASLYGVTRIIKSANTVLKAQGEIRSLDISTAGIDAITKAGLEMSLQYGQITAPEFIKSSYVIKSSMASLSDAGVKDMTKFAATTAIATKSSMGEMTKLYGLGYGIFRKDFSSDMNFGKQFSGAIASTVQAFNTDGADIAAGLSNIGSSAHSMGISLSEELSILGMAKGSYAHASEAGSGYRAFLDGVGKAQDSLGLKFTDLHGNLLPMTDVLTKIKNKFGDINLGENDALKAAFGSAEATRLIAALIPKIDALDASQSTLKKTMKGGLTQAQKMVTAMDSGYGFEKMDNALAYLSFTVGKSLAPAVDALASGLGGLAKGVAWLNDKVPWLIPSFSNLALGVLGLVTVMKVATLTKLGFKFAVLSARKSILISTASNLYNAMSFKRIGLSAILARGKLIAFSIGSKIATGAQWLFNAALTANPIGLVIAGVAALAAGAVALYQNFAPFTSFIDGLWAKLKGLFDFALSGFAKIGELIGGVASFLGFGDSKPVIEPIIKPKKKLLAASVGAAMAVSSPMVMAQPMPQYVASSTPQTHLAQVKQPSPAQQHFHIKVIVNNPSNNVDVETAIVAAMKKQSTEISLNDEVL